MKKLFVTALIVMFILTACKPGGSAADAAIAALEATRSAQNATATANAQAPTAEPPTAAPTEVPPTAAPTETATTVPTPTEVPTVKATTNSNANCRFGPDKVFSLVELLNAGTTALVIGQYTANGQWWKVRTDSGKECWVLGSSVSITGDPNQVPKLPSPATPTPVPPPSWQGDWHMRMSGNGTNVANSATAFDVYFSQKDNQISYDYSLWGIHFTGYGTVSADGMTVTGQVMSTTWTGNFIFKRVPGNLNQFQGKWVYPGTNNDGEFCGYKGTAGYPSPCRP